MKISDDELLRLVWLNQLRRLARGVVDKYIGDRFGLSRDDRVSNWCAAKTCRIARGTVTSILSSPQLWVRLKNLADQKRLHIDSDETGFFIMGPEADRACQAARQFWIDQGLLPSPHKPVKKENLDELAVQCEQLLLAKFSGCSLPQEAA